jgi:hypothetical protein
MSETITIDVSTTVQSIDVQPTTIIQNVDLEVATLSSVNVIDASTTIQNVDVLLSGLTGSTVNVDVIYPRGPQGLQGPMGPQGVNTWGSLTGDLSAQTDLWQYLSAGVGLDETALNHYLSTNNILLSGVTINGSLFVSGSSLFTDFVYISSNLFVEGSASFTNSLSVGEDLYVDGTLYTGNTAIVLGTYFQDIGDGINSTFGINHNLGSQDVHVVVRDLATNLLAFPAIQPVDPNNVNISFNFVPLLTSYNVSIFAGVPSNKISAYRIDLKVPPRPIANTFYVSMSGNDSNSGTEISLPLRTIRKACQLAHNARVESKNNPNIKYTIFVGTGDFYEENPIYVAPNTSIIGDNLRRVNVFPKNKTYDLFWVDNSTYIWGFTFRGHLEPAAVVAFPNYKVPALTSIALSGYDTPYVSLSTYKWRRPYITTSPYIQGSSSIAAGESGIPPGCGMRVDGSLAEGFLRSMVLDSYTQFNEGGNGIEIINNGYAQLVSIFTICCREGMVCRTGGSCSISNSNCSFGLSGLVATGKSPTPVLTGTVVGFVANPEDPFVTTTLVISGVEGTQIFPDSDYYPTILNTPGINLDTRKIAYTPYDGLIFDINSGTELYTINGTPLSSTPGTYTVNTLERINNETIIPGTKVQFYIRSTIYASAHTFEFIGTGTKLRNAVPALGGVSTPETEVIFDRGGAVFYTSTNHTGDFSIGEDFRVVQSTGTIEGDTFKRSILTLVTPLTLALE